MAGNEADIRADLEIDGSRAVNQLRRVSSEIRRTLRQAAELERTLNQAFGARTSVTGPRARALQGATGVARRGSDATAVTNSLIQGRAATIRASTPVLRETIQKQNEQLEKAIRAPQDRLRAAAEQSQRSFNRLLGVGGPQTSGVRRTQYERQLNSLFNARDKQIGQRQAVLQQRATSAQQSFNRILGVGDTRLRGVQRTQYENQLGSLLKNRDRQLQQSAQVLKRRASDAQQYYNRILGVGDTRLRGNQRTAYERQFASALDRRDRELGRAPPKSQRLSGAQVSARADQTRKLRDATLFGDGGQSLFRIQARLLAHYLVLNQVFSAYQFGIRFVVDFDRALQNLQAITVTSNTNMMALSVSLRQVSRETKFTAVEVAEAATILGQAGFSTTEIQDSIRSITLLAAATGSTLKQAVDVATSTLGVFNLQASEMASVANQITTAINRSKLNIEKLALGLQFAGNVAADAGLGLTELLAALSQFANAGVRSGSTLGTGIRQLIIDLAAPSRKLAQRYRELGLTVDETSIKTQGFLGVLRNLREAGFTSSDGLEFLEVRAANAFSAITKGLPELEEFQRSLLLTDSAVRANATQMLSLSNRWSRFVSVMGEVILIGSGPIAIFFKTLLGGVTSLGIAVANSGKAFTVLVSVLLGTGIAALTVWLSRVIGLTRVMTAATAATTGMAAATNVLAGALARIRLLFLTPGGLIGLAAFAGIAALTDGFGLFAKEADNTATAQDRAQAQFENTKGRVESLEQSISSINDTIQRLSERERRLDENQEELQTELIRTKDRFADLGLIIDGNVTSTGQLLTSLISLRSELRQGVPGAIEAQITSLQTSQAARGARVRERVAGTTPENIEGFLADQLGINTRAKTSRELLRQGGFLREPNEGGAALGDVLRNLGQGGSNLDFGRGVTVSEELLQLVDTALRLQFRPGAQGGLPDEELTRANALILQLQREAPQLGAGDPQRALLGRIQVLIGEGLRTNRETQLGAIELSSLDRQLNLAEFQERNESTIAAAVNRFQRGTTTRLAATQAFPDDPRRTQAELDRAVEHILSEGEALKATLLNSLLTDSAEDVISDEDVALYRGLYEIQVTNIVKAAQGTARRFREEAKKTNRARTGAQQKVAGRRVTNLVGQINSAGTLAEVQTLILSGLQGVPQNLIEESGLAQVLEEARKSTARRAPSEQGEEGANSLGALAQLIQVRLDRLETVETPGEPGQIQSDLRAAARQELIERLRTFLQTVERRLNRITSQQRSFDNARERLARGRQINPSQQASDLSTQARFDLSGAGHPLTRFDIQNQGTRGLGGRERLEARAQLETTVLQESISIYQTWVQAHQRVIEELESEVSERVGAAAAARQTVDTAREEEASLKVRTAAVNDLITSEKAHRESTTQLATAKRQLIDINRQLSETEIRLAAQREQQSIVDQLSTAISNAQTNLGLNRTWTEQLILGMDDFVRSFRDGFASVVRGFLTGTNTLQDVFSNFINKILDLAINQLANNLTNILLNSVQQGLSGGQSSGLGGILQNVFGSLFGGDVGSTGSSPFAQGGRVRGGTPGRDSVRSMLTPDEFVLRASSARSVGYDVLDNLNERGARALSGVQNGQAASIINQQNGPTELNVWIVQPDQLPPPSPSDIVAHVVTDGERGGSVKRLIKSIQVGAI